MSGGDDHVDDVEDGDDYCDHSSSSPSTLFPCYGNEKSAVAAFSCPWATMDCFWRRPLALSCLDFWVNTADKRTSGSENREAAGLRASLPLLSLWRGKIFAPNNRQINGAPLKADADADVAGWRKFAAP